MCYMKVLPTQQSLTYITILYNRNNVSVLLLTSFLSWTHAIITYGTGKYQLYTRTTAFWNPAWLVLSTKYINRIIKLSSLIRKLLDNASPVLKTTVLLIFTHFTTWQKPQPTHFYPLFQTQIRDTTSP